MKILVLKTSKGGSVLDKRLCISKWVLSIFFGILGSVIWTNTVGQSKTLKPLKVVIFGAHPDDANQEAGGTAAKWRNSGAEVTFVSLTNGNAGHQTLTSEELAKVRKIEAKNAGDVIGAKYLVLDVGDGTLLPTLENRNKVIKVIREERADVVISPRPYQYHPDHRYTGILVMDASYMVTVPKVLPGVPFLEKNPVFLWSIDTFSHPEPFIPDIAIDIDDVIQSKIEQIAQHKSQMFEWLPYNRGVLDEVPAKWEDKLVWLGKGRRKVNSKYAYMCRDKLIELYGFERGVSVKYSEGFEDSGYGTRLTKKNMYYYFPFLENKK